jgi:TPP-dependent pyruvate/acetoin dehydrogenase alpha subunit
MSDPGVSYRKREEIQDYRHTKDPILTLHHLGVQFNLVTEQELLVPLLIFRK